MEFGPIWRASMRNKTGIVLIVLQIAFTMTLIINSVGIVEENAKLLATPSGIDEDNIFHLRSSAYDDDVDARLIIEEDLRQIRATPGVAAAVQTNSVPISGGGWSMGLATAPEEGVEQVLTSVYMVDEHGVDALGVELIAGTGFLHEDVVWNDAASNWPSKVIVSKAVAEAIFPGDPTYGVGETVYIDQNEPMTVTGVVERLAAPWPGWELVRERAILVPRQLLGQSHLYLIRAEPGRRDQIMPDIETRLAASDAERIIQNMLTMDQTRGRTLDANGALVNILVFTVVVLVSITSLGVAGLTSFNVTRRIKQIGTRRALGASRRQILRYFLAENLLFTVIGVGFGTVLAVAINFWLVESFSVPRFSWYWLPITMIGLVAISLLAVLFPARRAARVPPAVATRTV
ncbi:MAG TPA: FtsX-like permease family protein [Gammaproteobacteria bacterium]|nr:FtsX-like permease family protein [Gammaproteobacteria bacterium]